MIFRIGTVVALLFLNIFFLLSCNSTRLNKNEKGVEAAMKKYDGLILKLDADAISLLYTPDGNLGNIAIGRDSIKSFLSTFKNIMVLSQSSTTSSIVISGDSAIQKGSYLQTDLISDKDTVKVKGDYETVWQWIKPKGWLIKKMTTTPKN
jgi:ketosteroid isomerase-like protein